MILIFLLNTTVVVLAVAIHYEFLYHATRLIPKLSFKPRLRIIAGVFTALIAHTIEVWLFTLAYYYIQGQGTLGGLEGSFSGTLFDCVYFSFTTYSTLGFGDIVPVGELRYLAGIESLTGLVLITWTASFLYFEMQRLWAGS